MDYEKKLKEALNSDNTDYEVVRWIEQNSPKLKESEDEKMKYVAIRACKYMIDNFENSTKDYEDAIAWLEKQGETYTKKDVDDAYLKGVTNTKNEIEKQYEANCQIRKDIATFIFNYKGNIKDRAKWIDYLGIKVSFAKKQGEQEETLCDKCKKEQPSHSCQDITALGRCALKMQSEQKPNPCDGCINCENGELREVEQKPAESNDIKGILLVHDEILNNLLERYKTSATFKTLIVNLKNWWNNTRIHLLSFNIEQKSAWSEEDEKNLRVVVDYLIADNGLTLKHINWLKSIKERVIPQLKQEWSEEDENHIQHISDFIMRNRVGDTDAIYRLEQDVKWLKSLKDRHTWKPSDEQMKGIECTIKTLKHQLNAGDNRLNSLYNDLKKLRGE